MRRFLLPILGLILIGGSACAPAETTPTGSAAVNAGRALDNTSPSNPTGPGSLSGSSPGTAAGWSGRFGY